MENRIRTLLKENPDFSGLITIDTTTDHLGFPVGFACREHQVKNEDYTRFATASVTKGFTAAAILRFVDRGQLSLDDTIGTYLSLEKTLIDPAITLLQLLDHTSGIADYFDEEIEGDYEALWKDNPTYRMRHTEDFFPLFCHRPPLAEPGKAFAYCNAGFILLGMVLEKVSGMPFSDVLRREVFKPLKMIATDMDALDQLAPNTASHYLPDGRSHIYSVAIVGGPDGGTYTTAGDLKRFWKGLLESDYLCEKTRAYLLEHAVPVSGPFYYGLGFWRKIEEKSLYKIYLRGEDPGVSVMSGYYPDSRSILSVFSNNASPAALMTMAVEKTVSLR